MTVGTSVTPRRFSEQAAMAAFFFSRRAFPLIFFVDGILRPVKLEEDEREPGVGQGLREGALLSETQAVGVELNIFAAGLFCRRDDLRQVVPNGRFTA